VAEKRKTIRGKNKMKLSELSNTSLRILSAIAMFVVLGLVVALEHYFPQIHAVRWLGVLILIGAIYETLKCFKNAAHETFKKHAPYFIAFVVWLILVLVSVYFVGEHPWIMLWLLMIIVGADVGGWLFGKIFGGDKMWKRLSEHKTWSGQIGGILCGTLMSVIFFLSFKPFGIDAIFTVLLGVTISLLSQYGDLTASFIKRCLGIKDFGNLLPGHGGILDRFDGWIYVLPFIWFFIR
jgi:phosphatidate cytidylyltransferase